VTWPDLRGQNNTSVREENLRHRLLRILRLDRFSAFLIAVATCCTLSAAQQSTANSQDQALAESVQELRAQVQELRAAVAEIRTEASQYRAESEELRKEIDSPAHLLRRRNHSAVAERDTHSVSDQS
jgi:peptidoglycan hydrolase CwlO-like protein